MNHHARSSIWFGAIMVLGLMTGCASLPNLPFRHTRFQDDYQRALTDHTDPEMRISALQVLEASDANDELRRQSAISLLALRGGQFPAYGQALIRQVQGMRLHQVPLAAQALAYLASRIAGGDGQGLATARVAQQVDLACASLGLSSLPDNLGPISRLGKERFHRRMAQACFDYARARPEAAMVSLYEAVVVATGDPVLQRELITAGAETSARTAISYFEWRLGQQGIHLNTLLIDSV